MSLLRDVEWITETCSLGWATMGVWPEDPEGTEIAAVAVNKSLHSSSQSSLASSLRRLLVVPTHPYSCSVAVLRWRDTVRCRQSYHICSAFAPYLVFMLT